MLVQLERVLMQFGHVRRQPFIQRGLAKLSKGVFDGGEGYVPCLLDECMVSLCKHRLLLIKLQTLQCMKIKKGIIFIMMVVSSQCILNRCATYKRKQISGNNLPYTTANLISDSQQPTILSLYSNLTEIDGYNIDLQYKIYSNKKALCNKTDPSILQINAYNDAWLCFDQFYLLKCNQVWELVRKCGTAVEIHRPFDPEILIQMDLEDVSWILDEYGGKMVNMDLKGLCAGMYHLWFVYYSRMGKFLKGVKPIYITYPSCNC